MPVSPDSEPPPLSCWQCGHGVAHRRALDEAVLHVRAPSEGGPFRSLRCGGCGAENGLLENDAGRALLHPLEGLGEPSLLDRLVPRQGREVSRAAQDWWTRNMARVERFRREPPAARGTGGAPPPRRPRRRPVRERPAAPKREPPPAPEQSTTGQSAPGRSASGQSAQGPSAPQQDPATKPPPQPPPSTLTELRGRAPHELLGIAEDAPEDEVRRAFRAALKRCHPDRVEHMDEDIRALAHAKAKAVRRAYETLLARIRRRQDESENRAATKP